ncbi:fumarylacetoacetate hydrolase family protein [Pigmentiphaga kullae]|uniref:2-keto-4-pentenoate hydratase/2-oxohepta-3-ene-1,7-dioic acid hydratase in catechol pathway n=1 Tax=Pigmentiphaga kullae TaxID=151784 RepID=A0A4Q7NBM2_9BURK|nr:fumarylacetoacetate hydrolase family protein [Pigmentiphaga kullae]RZS80263.1 2-keto-4-pentenoate hydratase/2-oxohepta-3-ene-1,7-dioic acid hydratase in catechol pathway [Pigmentiphaga kullae]
MKLVTFSHRGRTSIGKVEGTRVIDLAAADPALPATMRGLLAGGRALLQRARDVDPERAPAYPLADVRLEAPVPDPAKYLAIGMNYGKHVVEARRAGVDVPDSQVWFNKQVSCINGPYDPVHMPRVSDKLDYEAELGVVIGTRCRHVPAEQAREVIAGYLVCNDVSVRDWQRRSATMTLGKSFNTTGPIGPWIVTDDEVPDPLALTLRMRINGEVRQEARTGEMIYSIYDQIAYLSTVMTLEPGDILATGTPSGVGAAMDPPAFLKIGDVMRVEIDGIGHIENRVVAEPA